MKLNEVYEQYGYPSINKLWNIVKEKNLNYSYQDIKDFLNKQAVFQIHKKPTVKFTNFIRTGAPTFEFHMDLLDMTKFYSNLQPYRYILIVVDIFSKKAFASAMKNKTSEETKTNLQECFKVLGIPKVILSDDGSEFKGEAEKYMSSLNILHLVTKVGDHNKLGIIDRFSQTLKVMLYKHFTDSNTVNWINVYKKYVDNYNNTIHSSLCNQTPIQADKNVSKTVHCMYDKIKSQIKDFTPLNISDSVRIIIPKGKLDKGYTKRWSDEIYTVIKKDGLNYTLNNNKQYRIHELQKVIKPEKQTNSNELNKAIEKQNVTRLNYASGLDVNKETGDIEIPKRLKVTEPKNRIVGYVGQTQIRSRKKKDEPVKRARPKIDYAKFNKTGEK